MSCDLPVGRIARAPILHCPPDLPLSEAAALMCRAHCSFILVMEGDRALGIWTEHDALKVDFCDADALRLPVAAVMSSPVKTIPSDLPLREITTRFQHDCVRHYLVVAEDGTAHGIVSQSDVVLHQGIEEYLWLREVQSTLRGQPLKLSGDTTLSAATQAMHQSGCDAAVVTGADGTPGILTERDVVRCVAEHRGDCPIAALASRPLLTVRAQESLYQARNLLVERRIRHLGVIDDGGAIVGLLGLADILASIERGYLGELKEALRDRDRALDWSRKQLQLAERVIESTLEGIIITDAQGRIQSVNPAFTRLTGYSAEEAIGKSPSLFSSGRHSPDFYRALWETIRTEGHWHGEIWNRRKDGVVYLEQLTITAIRDDSGAITHYTGLFRDITERKEHEEHIRRLAYHDALTGLPNRLLFNDRLSLALAHAHRSGQRLALIFVDLDRFKKINDTLGHNAGDLLLQKVAQRFKQCLREDDTVARLSGDEFIIMLPEVSDITEPVKAARRVIDALGAPLQAGGHEITVTCSIGISIYPEDGTTADVLLKHADTAMYRAKDLGRNRYQLYTAAQNARSFERLAMEKSLRDAIERDELVLHFQALVDLAGGRTAGAEALLRWQHPDLGLAAPAQFIQLAEETGLIVPIRAWVVRKVCEQIRAWQAADLAAVPVAVNLSARQLREQEPAAEIEQILLESGVDPELVCFEVSESALLQEAEDANAIVRALHRIGCRIAVDNFGAGYASVRQLKRLPIARLKIDRSLLRDITTSPDEAAIVQAMIGLAHQLSLTVVAEGIELEEQRSLLRDLGCDEVQGYLLGLPVPGDAFAQTHLQPPPSPRPHRA
jgi:diguanylate cyclase (GGDEF)-like protein/PAS domain S-box-containing protein